MMSTSTVVDDRKRGTYNRACIVCARLKKKCDGGRPCERCVSLGISGECTDAPRKSRRRSSRRGNSWSSKTKNRKTSHPAEPSTTSTSKKNIQEDFSTYCTTNKLQNNYSAHCDEPVYQTKPVPSRMDYKGLQDVETSSRPSYSVANNEKLKGPQVKDKVLNQTSHIQCPVPSHVTINPNLATKQYPVTSVAFHANITTLTDTLPSKLYTYSNSMQSYQPNDALPTTGYAPPNIGDHFAFRPPSSSSRTISASDIRCAGTQQMPARFHANTDCTVPTSGLLARTKNMVPTRSFAHPEALSQSQMVGFTQEFRNSSEILSTTIHSDLNHKTPWNHQPKQAASDSLDWRMRQPPMYSQQSFEADIGTASFLPAGDDYIDFAVLGQHGSELRSERKLDDTQTDDNSLLGRSFTFSPTTPNSEVSASSWRKLATPGVLDLMPDREPRFEAAGSQQITRIGLENVPMKSQLHSAVIEERTKLFGTSFSSDGDASESTELNQVTQSTMTCNENDSETTEIKATKTRTVCETNSLSNINSATRSHTVSSEAVASSNSVESKFQRSSRSQENTRSRVSAFTIIPPATQSSKQFERNIDIKKTSGSTHGSADEGKDTDTQSSHQLPMHQQALSSHGEDVIERRFLTCLLTALAACSTPCIRFGYKVVYSPNHTNGRKRAKKRVVPSDAFQNEAADRLFGYKMVELRECARKGLMWSYTHPFAWKARVQAARRAREAQLHTYTFKGRYLRCESGKVTDLSTARFREIEATEVVRVHWRPEDKTASEAIIFMTDVRFSKPLITKAKLYETARAHLSYGDVLTRKQCIEQDSISSAEELKRSISTSSLTAAPSSTSSSDASLFTYSDIQILSELACVNDRDAHAMFNTQHFDDSTELQSSKDDNQKHETHEAFDNPLGNNTKLTPLVPTEINGVNSVTSRSSEPVISHENPLSSSQQKHAGISMSDPGAQQHSNEWNKGTGSVSSEDAKSIASTRSSGSGSMASLLRAAAMERLEQMRQAVSKLPASLHKDIEVLSAPVVESNDDLNTKACVRVNNDALPASHGKPPSSGRTSSLSMLNGQQNMNAGVAMFADTLHGSSSINRKYL